MTQVVELRQVAKQLRTKAEAYDRAATELEKADAIQFNGFSTQGRPAESTVATTRKRRNGKATKKSATTKAAKVKIRTRVENELSLRSTILVILKKTKKGLKLAEVVEKVLATGYTSSVLENGKDTAEGKFSQIVYQTLNKLMNKDSLVVREKDTHRYKLTGTGKKWELNAA